MVDAETNLYAHGRDKYGATDVLRSSIACDWSGVAAEWRHHPAMILTAIDLAQTEIGIATGCHSDAVVERSGGGALQRTKVAAGTTWTCPAGTHENLIELIEWHDCLHIYLPSSRFTELSDLRGGAPMTAMHIRYLADLQDPLIVQIGSSLLAELRAPSSAGRVLAETLALALTARLVQAYADRSITGSDPVATCLGLDDLRLRRVIAYMAEHLAEEIGIDDLAAVACLSPFHFIRMFRNRTGVPPGRYLAQMRLQRAKAMLALGNVPLSEVAASCCFSSQANFTRAFRRATGITPGMYRRGCS